MIARTEVISRQAVPEKEIMGCLVPLDRRKVIQEMLLRSRPERGNPDAELGKTYTCRHCEKATAVGTRSIPQQSCRSSAVHCDAIDSQYTERLTA